MTEFEPVEKANFKALAYTCKKLGGKSEDVKKTDYEPLFTLLRKKKIDVEYIRYERDSDRRLHVHGIVYIPKGYRYKQIQPQGFRTYYKEIYHKDHWIRYIHKDEDYEIDSDTEISIDEPQSPPLKVRLV